MILQNLRTLNKCLLNNWNLNKDEIRDQRISTEESMLDLHAADPCSISDITYDP